MRLAVCALSAVLLSGCSWLGMGGDKAYYDQNGQAYYYGKAPAPQNPYGANTYGVQAQNSGNAYGNFPQKPDFSSGYGSGGYGSHAANAGHYNAGHNSTPKLKKPKLRGTFSMGFEKSNSGSYIDYTKIPTLDPAVAYNPDAFAETSVAGTTADPAITTTTYSGVVESIEKPDIAFDDAHSTPFRMAAGLEYIMSPHLTVFAEGAYSRAEGEQGAAVTVQGGLTETISIQPYNMGVPNGPPTVNTTLRPNAGAIARYSYDFGEMERFDGQLGARYYFDPIVKDQAHRTLTPFVSVSGGVAHYNGQSMAITQEQAYYQANYTNPPPADEELSVYTVGAAPQIVDLYDSQVVPLGTVKAGMEWQVTPKMGLALETGIKYEGARDYANGNKGDANIAIPLTLRGSFNF